LYLFDANAQSQTGEIRGLVTDTSGLPIPNAEFRIYHEGKYLTWE
jgi:hypothetical protein